MSTAQGSTSQAELIIDIGSNNGDDIPYYLFKAARVVAVEPNPALCDLIRQRFAEPIREGRLFVENVAVVATEQPEVDFYVHNRHHVLSSLSVDELNASQFTKLTVNAITIHELVCRYGSPYYIKIDVEGHDEILLRSLADHQIMPPYISAESHKLGVFALLSETMGYQSFKLVDGRSVGHSYSRALFRSPILGKTVAYSFPHHSAGPFGNDIFGEWMDKPTLLRQLAIQGLGWRDIHASSVDEPTLKA
jgi:FkbM family methyltransferase